MSIKLILNLVERVRLDISVVERIRIELFFNMLEILRGSSVRTAALIYNSTFFAADALFDPSSVKITITDPNGLVKVNGVAMTKSAVGKYYYDWQTATADAVGTYTLLVLADDTLDGKKESKSLSLV